MTMTNVTMPTVHAAFIQLIRAVCEAESHKDSVDLSGSKGYAVEINSAFLDNTPRKACFGYDEDPMRPEIMERLGLRVANGQYTFY